MFIIGIQSIVLALFFSCTAGGSYGGLESFFHD